MCVLHLYTIGVLFRLCYCSDQFEDMDYASLHCRNNDNKPVDWWFIYKPPSDVFPFQLGYNFSYVTPSTAGRWHVSKVPIDRNSMLVNTVMPMYKSTYVDHLAVAVYQNQDRHSGRTPSQTFARGILMADEMGGFLLTHTVPGFPNIHANRPYFPPEETANGQLLACISLDLKAINKVAQALQIISPNFIYDKLPESLKVRLPGWNFENIIPDVRRKMSVVEFETRGNSVALLARPPGSKACIYRTFADRQQVNLNVYGQSREEYLTSVCSQNFGIRNIDIISLKYSEEVHYIRNCTDRTWFAVSTAAPWQQKGAGPTQYWTCTSNMDKEDHSGAGGLLLCIQNYGIWRTFDNLKVKEPEC